MPYIVIYNGVMQKRYLLGSRPFAEVLTASEIDKVRKGILVGTNARGDILNLSSPLEEGAEVILRQPCAEDLEVLGIPSHSGDLVPLTSYLKDK